MRLIYLAHPVSASTPEGVKANLERGKRWLRWVYLKHPDVTPVAPWITACEVLDDHNPEHRAHGLACDIRCIERCDELWLVGGRVSRGMELERAHAYATSRVKVVDLTPLGEEPPTL